MNTATAQAIAYSLRETEGYVRALNAHIENLKTELVEAEANRQRYNDVVNGLRELLDDQAVQDLLR